MATQAPNFQPPPTGFGSYLSGILPDDIAVAAGAFSVTMQQVINIKDADFEKFSQVAASIEVTNTNLPLINGTDVPVDLTKTAQNTIINALGSGPHGTYVASDFFGCMSGLPYNWRELQSTLLKAQTTKLQNIYQELFLAVTWEGAAVTVIVETRQVLISPGPPPVYQTEYRCAGFAVSNKGGGYGRGAAPDPVITASNGGSGLGIVGRSPPGAQSVGGGTYGRINSTTLTSAGSWVLSPPTATIQYPPTATLAVQASGAKSTGGSNTATGTVGWPSPMNTVTQAYVTQANSEVQFIASNKPKIVKRLNSIYNYNGKQLEIEQRCRYQALDPVPIPRNRFLSAYPTSVSSFVDAISTYAQSTRPHMYAQTLEAISDLKNVCGQSSVGLMRQERNVERLQKINVSVENNIPGKIATELEKPLIANGTLPVGRKGSGIEVTGINGNKKDPISTYTAPSTLVQQLEQAVNIAPKPRGYFNPTKNKFILTTKTTPIAEPLSVEKILAVEEVAPLNNVNLLGPGLDGLGPPMPVSKVSNLDPAAIQAGVGKQIIPVEPIVVVAVGAETPTGDEEEIDDGSATYPGSLAGSPDVNLIPPNLDLTLTSGVLLPSTLSVPEAIDDVIKCNCDCWID